MLGFNGEGVSRPTRHRSPSTTSCLQHEVGILITLTLTLTVACSSWSTATDERTSRSAGLQGPMFQTDSGAYHLVVTPTATERLVRIGASFTNTTGATVYMMPCGNSALMRLEKRVSDGWQVAYQPVCTLEARSPIKVPPGATYRDTATVLDNLAPNTLPKFMVSPIEGTYRAVYAGFSSWDPSRVGGPPGEPLQDGVSMSNEFTIAP